MLQKTLLIACLIAFATGLFSFTDVNKDKQLLTEPDKCSANVNITISGLQEGCSVRLESPAGIVATYSANGTYSIIIAAPSSYSLCEFTGQIAEACDSDGILVSWVKTCGTPAGGSGTISGPNCLTFELTCCSH